jgi:two-component SAPR family response regulator
MTEDPVRILLIEDDTVLRSTLIELLEEKGYWVRGVPSSEDAIALAHETSFDLVVTDIRTEGQQDGLSALAQVREQQPEVAAVVITGYSTEDYALRAVKLRVEDYLKKPFQLTDFLQRVELIARRKVRLKQEAREKAAVRETILWFAERMARAVSFGEGFELEAYFQTVDQLCRRSDLQPGVSEEIKLAASIAIAEENDDLELPTGVQETLPPSVLHFVYHSREHWDGSGEPEGLSGTSIPIGSRIIRLAHLRGVHKGATWFQLAELHPGQLDPNLIELEKVEASDPKSSQEQARNLLLLGNALEDVGNTEPALISYRELAEKYPRSRFAANALLGMARILRGQGRMEPATGASREALELARQQGPALLALSTLEVGLNLSPEKVELGLEALLEAAELMRQLRDQGGRATSILALAHFWERGGSVEAAVDALISDRFTSEFVRIAPWLLRFATDKLGDEARQSVLRKAARDCPTSLVELCTEPTVATTRRAEIFAGVREFLPTESMKSIVQRLSNDPQDEVRLRAEQVLGNTQNGRAPVLPTLRLFTFGGIRVFRGSERIDRDWRRIKAQYFLAYLMQLGDRALSDESLVDVFWPGPLKKGRISLRGALSYLRKKLVPEDAPDEINYFLKPPGLVKLNTALPIWYDLLEFDRSLAQFRKLKESSKPESAITLAQQLVNLYRGPFLEDCYMDWAVETRERTDLATVEALTFLQESSLNSERIGEAVEYGERATALDPSCEAAYEGLMRAHLAESRPSDALRAFQKCEAILQKEYDLEPSEELLELRDQALSQG